MVFGYPIPASRECPKEALSFAAGALITPAMNDPGTLDGPVEPEGGSSDAPGSEGVAEKAHPGNSLPGKTLPESPWLHHRAPHTNRPHRPASGWLHRLGFGADAGAKLRRFARQRPITSRSMVSLLAGGALVLWLAGTSLHRIGAQEQGLVTRFGAYQRTLGPGMAVTLPWPVEQLTSEDVTTIRHTTLPEGDGENLILTRDGGLVNCIFDVRWNLSSLARYRFSLADPERTVRDSAESVMRQTLAEHRLGEGLGSGRAEIEETARDRLQALLDRYHAGVAIAGIDIRRTDPPAKAIDAFRDVSAARQDADTDVTQARAWAAQMIAHADGEAAAFDKVYEQYRLAPEVTRRRMYYETMERVLSQTDKVIIGTPGVAPVLPLPALPLGPKPAEPPAGGAH